MANLCSPGDLDRLRARAEQPAFAAAAQRLRRDCNRFLAADFAVPERPAGFYHNYFCPTHAVQLEFDPARPDRHRCSGGGEILSGDPFDAAWVWFVNNELSTMAFSLAVLGQMDEERSFLERVGEILLGYAEVYRSYETTAPRSRGRAAALATSRREGEPPPPQSDGLGKATYQSLDEAVWLIPLVRAYDLVRGDLPASDRERIESGLLRPAAEHIQSQRYRTIHNIENWHNAALAAVGFCLDDAELANLAIDAEFGFHRQLAAGVRNDGLWWEGSSSYHFYALWPLVLLAQICAPVGRDLWRHPRLEQMFRAPLALVLPDLRLPATNDCWLFSSLLADLCHGVPPAASFYEIAHAWYDDPAFAWPLGRNYRQRERDSLEALLWGRSEIGEEDESFSSAGVDCTPSGLAMLRSFDPLERQSCLLLKYGPHGGGHGHPDKLAVSIYAGGEPVCPDLGTPGYGIELNQTWYRQTLSHNTIVVDGHSHPPAEGVSMTFARDAGGFGVVDAKVDFDGDPYRGVSIRRTILWAEGYCVDVVLVHCDRERQIDWTFRSAGELVQATGLAAVAVPRLEGAGYEHVAAPRAWRAGGPASLHWRLERTAFGLHLPDEGASTIIRGKVPGNPAAETSDLVIRRRRTAETVYLAVLELAPGAATTVASRPCQDSRCWEIEVTGRDRTEHWLVCPPDTTATGVEADVQVNRYSMRD